jgi:hypothetical protein
MDGRMDGWKYPAGGLNIYHVGACSYHGGRLLATFFLFLSLSRFLLYMPTLAGSVGSFRHAGGQLARDLEWELF